MCNLSMGVYEEGFYDGKAKGRAEGKAEGIIIKSLEFVENLLKKNFTLEEALELAGIDKETYEKYKK